MDTSAKKLDPLVSITVVTYNRGSYLKAAIESVLAQTYADWELIIVDDGSVDETQTLLASYADPRVQVIRHATNEGISVSRTEALTATKGTYIAVLDSDDLWNDPAKLEKQVAFLERHPEHVIVGTFINVIDENGSLVRKTAYHTDDAAIRQHLLMRNQFAHSSVLMRASTIRATGGYQEVPLGEDLDLFLRLGLHGKFANLPQYLASYRVHAGGVSRNGVLMAKSVLGFIRTHRAHYPDAFRARAKTLLTMLLAHLFDVRSVSAPRSSYRDTASK